MARFSLGMYIRDQKLRITELLFRPGGNQGEVMTGVQGTTRLESDHNVSKNYLLFVHG